MFVFEIGEGGVARGVFHSRDFRKCFELLFEIEDVTLGRIAQEVDVDVDFFLEVGD